MNHIKAKLVRTYSSDPKGWATLLLICDFMRSVKKLLYSRLLCAPGLNLGKGSTIRGAKYISFGRRIYAHSYLWLEAISNYEDDQFAPKLEIGDEVSFSSRVHISCIEHIVIKKGCLMGSGVYISDHNHGAYKGADQSEPGEPPNKRILSGGAVHIGENVWIGDNVIIVGPVTIGDGVIVGANSVVKEDIPAGTMVAGIPAAQLKRFNAATRCWERV